jgi:Mn-dependent DtxR family transcriptional regulator
MPTAIRIKLADLLIILMEVRRPLDPEIEKDLETIKQHLLTSGPARTRDLAMELHMSYGAAIHRLNLLKDRGLIVDLPDHKYGGAT